MKRSLHSPVCKPPLLVFSLALLFSISGVMAGFAGTIYTVTNTNDSGDNSLRKAIELANQNSDLDTIQFNIPGAGDQMISVYSPLVITNPVIIQGPNANGGEIWLNGQSASAGSAVYSGLQIEASGCTIRGLVIGNFTGNGIYVGKTDADVSNTTIAGNQISGQFVAGNKKSGIYLFRTTNTMIGGSTPADRNIISGNNEYGIVLHSGGNNIVQGNYVGVNIDGTASRSNGYSGIYIAYSDGNTIGGTTSAARNIISGHSEISSGINLYNASENTIQGNYVGTNAAGTAALPNFDGIHISQEGSSNNTIGGTESGMGNLISGNEDAGIRLVVSSPGANNRVLGNTIGTNAAKTAAIPNLHGIRVHMGDGVVIGGTSAGAGNLISGNASNGIIIPYAGVVNTVIQGNHIGTDGTGAGPLGNGSQGIDIYQASGTTIGGTGAGAANTIAYNGRTGVRLSYSNSPAPEIRHNSIRGNSIYGNGILGIDLSPNGVTPNDPGDPDTGPNELQNFPVLTGVQANGGQTRVSGTLNSIPGKTYHLDFFAGGSCDPSGYGQGEQYLGSAQATTDSGGNASFQATLNARLTGSGVVTATATDPDGNTSEFSACHPYTAKGGSGLPGILMLLLQDG